MQECILVIDDDTAYGESLRAYLTTKGFKVVIESDGQKGLRTAYAEHPDVVLVDVMMPAMDGWRVCQRLRELSDVPIIIVSARGGEDDVVNGFRLGADDYVRKPVSVRELEGHIRAILKRVRALASETPQVYDDGTLRIDLGQQRAWRKGEAVQLTPTEFRLLKGLLSRKGNVVSHQELLTEVWGPRYADARTNLSLYIRYVREKLEDNPAQPRYIQTKWGVGYWFAPNGHGVF
ncbi:MAG TPA: response regulator transcription factor [Anaerolineae bacterium]